MWILAADVATTAGQADAWAILRDVLVLLAAAGAVGLLFEWFRQSAIVGALVAGTLVGPGLLGWVRGEYVSSVAELGVALLLFTIGLEITWARFRSFGRVAAGGGLLQILITGAAATAAAALLGVGVPAAVAVGAMVALSSTATVLRILHDKAEIESIYGRVALGVLLVQDVAVIPLVLLVTFMGTEGGVGSVAAALGTAAGKAAALVFALLVLGLFILPRMLDLTALKRSRELPVVLAVVAWLGATWGAHAMGLSPALGAFAAGMILADSPFAGQIRADVAPLRVVFVTLFFASLGLLADLPWLFTPTNLATVAAVVAAIVIGKAGIVWLIVRRFGLPSTEALASGIALAQIGEFSFVLAAIARGNGLLDEAGFQLIVSSTLATLLLTPLLADRARRLAALVNAVMKRIDLVRAGPEPHAEGGEELHGHVIVVGVGPAGSEVVAALQRVGLRIIVLELNPRTVALARERGITARVGDAGSREILEEAGLERARALVVTVPDFPTASRIIAQAQALAPHVPIIARARYHIYAERIEAAGADVVVNEEETVGRLLGDQVLRRMDEPVHEPAEPVVEDARPGAG